MINAIFLFLFRCIAAMGQWAVEGMRGIGALTLLFLRCLVAFPAKGVKYRREIIEQLYFFGVGSLPVIITSGVFAGAVFAYTSYNQLANLSVGSWAGAFMVKLMTWHFGPVLIGLVLAGRVGCAITAEIGTMNVTEQVDAMRSFGVDPVAYLVMPRLVAGLVMTPLLTAIAIFIGVLAGMFMIVCVMGGESYYQWKGIEEQMIPYDYVQGIAKGVVFGALIALICCRNGLDTRGGAEGVGRATTSANVSPCIAILITNLGVSVVLTKAEPLWNKFMQLVN